MRWLLCYALMYALAFTLPTSTARAAADTEPNDTLETTSPTGLHLWDTVLVPGGRIGNGSLGAADRDIYWFEVSPETAMPVRLTVTLVTTGGDLDGYVRVFDATGYDLARLDDSDGSVHPALQTYLLEPGMYYVGVSDALNPAYGSTDAQSGREAKTGEYELAMTLWHAPSLGKSLEPNDSDPTPVHALPFVARRQFIGDGPNLRLDQDRYRVRVDATSILSITVAPDPTEALDPLVSVFAGGDVMEAVEGFDSVANIHRARRIELAIPGEAEYVDIVIRGTADAPDERDRQFGSVGFYDLHLDLQPVAAEAGPYEPNDSLLQATPSGLSVPGTVSLSAFVGDGEYGQSRGDIDLFDAGILHESVLQVDVKPLDGSDLNPVVVWYDREGLELERWHADADREIHVERSLSCEELAWHLYDDVWLSTATIAVMGVGDRVSMDPFIPGATPDYGCQRCGSRASLSRYLLDGGPGSTGAYELALTRTTSPCDDEPNDTIHDASETMIVNSGQYSCMGVPAGNGPCATEFGDERDVDIYHVSVTSAPRRLDVSLKSCSTLAGVVRLFDAAGNELDTMEPLLFWGVPLEGSMSSILESPGDYFIGMSAYDNDSYDPFEACSGHGWSMESYDHAAYDLNIRMSDPNPASAAAATGPVKVGEAIRRLFAARMDPFPDTIVELDPDTGDTLNELPAPEIPLGGGEGIAFDGTDVRMLGNNARFPFLYRLDAETGDVLEQRLTWFGSGFYGGMTLLGGNLYVVDLLEDVIWVVSQDIDRVVSQLDVGRLNGVSMFGAIAAQVAPARLVVADAATPSKLHVLDASDGRRLTTLNLGGVCPCDADFDADGDVDVDDLGFFEACGRLSGVAFGCAAADLNCDGTVGLADAGIIACQVNRPGLPPNANCCPDVLPPSTVRATGLAVTGADALVAADWAAPFATQFDWQGTPLATIRLDAPAGALGGTPFANFADFDGDGNVDLIDWRHFQICFSASARESPINGCQVFDFDGDDRLDLFDYAAFHDAMTGARP